jgi:hypothetical protein
MASTIRLKYLESPREKRCEVLRRTAEDDTMNVHCPITELEREI